MTTAPPTDRQILDAAQYLMQVRGYNAFSYADIADQVGVRKATIHYHFQSKAELARAVVARYRVETRAMMAALDRETADPRRRIERYIALYEQMVHGGPRICLCAMLSAETPTLPAAVQAEVRGFFVDHEAWLGGVLEAAASAGALCRSGPNEGEARLLLAGIDGAMLAARVHGDPARFDAVTRRLLAAVLPPAWGVAQKSAGS